MKPCAATRSDDRVPEEIGDYKFGLPLQPIFGLFPSDYTSRVVRPQTILQALMEQAPGDPLAESLEEAQPIIDAITFAQRAMSAEDLFVLDAINAEGVTYEVLAGRLGLSQTQTHRIHKRALGRLRSLLLNSPLIRERLNMNPTWNAACLDELISIAGYDEGWPDNALLDIGDTVSAIAYATQSAVDSLSAERELDVSRGLTVAAEAAVMYLRSVGKWRLLGMLDLLCSKQHDYGHNNILAFGMTGVVVRASDKAARLVNVSSRTGVKPRNETLLDTFYDIVGYAVIARMLKAETFEYELDEDNNNQKAA